MALQFPLRGTLEGLDIVIVPVSEYDRLCALNATAEAASDQPLRTTVTVDQMVERLHARGGSRRKVLYDIEVARFLIAKLDTMPPAAVREACIERFGIERTPSGYAIERLSADVCEERSEALRLEALGSGFTTPKASP